MDVDENIPPSDGPRPRPPRSKIPGPHLPRLQELSESENNAHSMTMPPPSNAQKRGATGLPEPDPKRKTLVARAGEIPSKNGPAPPSHRPVNGYVKSVASAGPRGVGTYSSGGSYRQPSNSSRSTSNSSTSSFRGGSSTSSRPQTAFSFNRGYTNGSIGSMRPATSMDHPVNNVNTHNGSIDFESRFSEMDKQLDTFNEQMKTVSDDRKKENEKLDVLQVKAKSELTESNTSLQSDNEELRSKIQFTTITLEDTRRSHALEMDDVRRKHRNELEDLREDQRRKESSNRRDTEEELDRLTRRHTTELEDAERKMRTAVDEERERSRREVADVLHQLNQYRQSVEEAANSKECETQATRNEIAQLNNSIEQERTVNAGLKEKLGMAASQTTQLESDLQAARAKTQFLESDSQAQSQAFADSHARMQEAIATRDEAMRKLRAEETLRRKLHNQVQELKGNIRVFCRVRPSLKNEEEPARIAFPDGEEDCKEIVVTGPEKKTAIGNDATSKHNFAFDRVFAPVAVNADIFDEISQLVQSALDGYNVCIFCYGQTGSGKTYTMSSADGMIPLAVRQIYDTANGLQEKGWSYSMEGSFVEVYNENLNDLLGKADEIDKKKLEIRHDKEKCRTTITDVTTVTLDSPSTVSTLLNRASANRSVAATKANERSSRSHSVFILKLVGENSITGERSEGTLNLVDLAGSERLAHSAASGDRLKETQSINKSLSCLGDVISALGQGKDGGHIPYRNSKLTYLLQHSLGGNSKTLMFVMVSPLAAHLGETITSLKFATKVHNTHIGTAKKQTKVRD
ncbi:MAG: hypothetical protein Q9162_001506 [Coniocarpon cinnabarinum]